MNKLYGTTSIKNEKNKSTGDTHGDGVRTSCEYTT